MKKKKVVMMFFVVVFCAAIPMAAQAADDNSTMRVKNLVVENAQINEAKIKQAEIDLARIKKALIQKANIKEAEVKRLRAEMAEFERAHFEYVKIKQAEVELLKVKLAEIETANIKTANIQKANISSVNYGRKCPGFGADCIPENKASNPKWHILGESRISGYSHVQGSIEDGLGCRIQSKWFEPGQEVQIVSTNCSYSDSATSGRLAKASERAIKLDREVKSGPKSRYCHQKNCYVCEH